MRAIVWSKNNCPYCEQAKALLKMKGAEYEERNIDNGWNRQDLLAAVPNARSVPQIFIDDQLIGGFTDLKKFFESKQ